MSNLLRAVTIAIAGSFGGCAIHPIPDNVTGVSTYDIVRNIRCEARDAIRAKIILFLAQVEGDSAATRYAELLHNDQALWAKFNDRWFSPQVTAMLQRFEGSAIAYNFALDMTEVNNFDPAINLTGPFSSGTFTSSITGGFDRSRENARSFTITDTWLKLVKTVDDVYCQPFAHVANYIYPITGKVGIDEMIDTFVVLSLFGDLSAPSGSSGKPPTMSDDITFTTLVSLGGTPKVVFTPLKNALSVADASIGVTLSRRDKHEVTVGLSLPVPPAAAAVGKSKPNELLLTAAGGPAAQAAAQAVEQSITRFQLRGQPIVVTP